MWEFWGHLHQSVSAHSVEHILPISRSSVFVSVRPAAFSVVIVRMHSELGTMAVGWSDWEAVEIVAFGTGVEWCQVENYQQHCKHAADAQQ